MGGELIHVDFTTTNPEDLTDLLKRRGVDVVINALGTFDYEAKTKLLEAIIPLAKNLLLYIPSEFGVYVPLSHLSLALIIVSLKTVIIASTDLNITCGMINASTFSKPEKPGTAK